MAFSFKFLKLLSKEDLIDISKAFGDGAEHKHRVRANALVMKIVEKGERHLPARQKKPGPKSSFNSTDHELASRLTNARDILGLDPQATKPETFAVMASALRDGKRALERYVYFASEERQSLAAACQHKGSCEAMRHVIASATSVNWKLSTSFHMIPVEKTGLFNTSRKGILQDIPKWNESEAYTALATGLGMLMTPKLANDLRTQRQSVCSAESFTDQELPTKFEHLTIPRPVLLDLACNRLSHFRVLSLDVDFGVEGGLLDDLHSALREFSYAKLPPKDARVFGQIWRSFFDALDRQGSHPFEHLDQSDWVVRPDKSLVGLPFTGGIRDFTRSARVKAERMKPHKPRAKILKIIKEFESKNKKSATTSAH